MKRILLLQICILCMAAMGRAQSCPGIEGLTPITVRFGINDSNFPTIPLYWNRFFKANESTGYLEAVTCSYTGDPNLHEFAYCACFLTGLYCRMVTDVCDPTPCGGYVPAQPLPKTNNGNGSSGWSQAATWTAAAVPDISNSIAVLITKSVQVDQDLNIPKDHWLSLSAGNSSILSGSTVVCNAVIQVYTSAQLENFGTLKGSGQIAGSFTNSGILSPGNSPGKFSVVGNYTATATAVHQIEIAASNLYDTISIAKDASAPGGAAVLNGTLNVSLLNGFAPSSGDSYKIMTYTSATGNFTNVNLPALRTGLSWAVNYNATDITLQVSGVLPVTISSINVQKKNNGVQVDWTTENEINVQNYEVESSADGIYFSKGGSVNANAGAINHYSWFDALPVNGKNYYRIKAIDADGKFKYSKILLINIAGSNQVAIYPNPVKKGAMLQLDLQNTKATAIEISNEFGQVLYRKAGELTGNISIAVPAVWPAGQYLLTVISNDKFMTRKILVE